MKQTLSKTAQTKETHTKQEQLKNSRTKYARKKLEELNLLDNFLFGSMVTHPTYGEIFSRSLLQVILNREFKKLTVIPQKVYYGSDTDLHGARLDVYLEEAEDTTEDATIYDVEPDKTEELEAVKALPKRVRFYHAKMDVRRSLKCPMRMVPGQSFYIPREA